MYNPTMLYLRERNRELLLGETILQFYASCGELLFSVRFSFIQSFREFDGNDCLRRATFVFRTKRLVRGRIKYKTGARARARAVIYEKRLQRKNGGATNKTYQQSVAAPECDRQRTRIWLDRSLDCILHSTNIETPCAQLNPRQRGRWNIEFAELNRRMAKRGVALAKSLRYKKKERDRRTEKKSRKGERLDNGGTSGNEEGNYWHNAKSVHNFDSPPRLSPLRRVTSLATRIRRWRFFYFVNSRYNKTLRLACHFTAQFGVTPTERRSNRDILALSYIRWIESKNAR